MIVLGSTRFNVSFVQIITSCSLLPFSAKKPLKSLSFNVAVSHYPQSNTINLYQIKRYTYIHTYNQPRSHHSTSQPNSSTAAATDNNSTHQSYFVYILPFSNSSHSSLSAPRRIGQNLGTTVSLMCLDFRLLFLFTQGLSFIAAPRPTRRGADVCLSLCLVCMRACR